MILAMVFCVTPTAILMLIFAPEILSLLGEMRQLMSVWTTLELSQLDLSSNHYRLL